MTKELKEFEKYLIKHWGKQCKNFSALCATCLVWQSFNNIKSLEDTKYHLTDWNKVLKN
jgi:hypothetical protein